MTLLKVVANDSSYCSKFFYLNEISKMGVLGPKNVILTIFSIFTAAPAIKKLLRTSNIIQSLK